MKENISNYFSQFITLSLEMAPYLVLGFLFAGILHVYFPKHKVVKYLGKSNFRSVLNSAMIGVPLPLCSCGVIPTGISFYKSGASKGSSVSFLISTPQTGVDSIMATYSLLGLPMAILRPFIAFVTGIFGGILTNKLEGDVSADSGLNEKEAAALLDGSGIRSKNKLVEIFRYAFFEFLEDIAKWLVIGLLLAALIAVLIPDDFFTRYIGNNILSMLFTLAAAVPLYVCATGSIPIAAVLMMKGLSPGAAIVFLMAGPATNAATITVIGKVLGRKTLFSYLASIIGGAMFFGLVVDYLLPKEWFGHNMMTMAHMDHSHGMLPYWLSLLSAILLGIFTLWALIRKYILNRIEISKPNTQIPEFMKQITVRVEGMTCNHCKMNVESKLGAIDGITEVKADPASSMVRISGEHIDLDQIKRDVESIGYTYAGQAS